MKREELIEKIVAINYHAFESAILAGGMSETRVAKDILDLCQPQWVSVEDRLPEYGERVLVMMFDDYRQCANWFNNWVTDDKSGQVTHWIPLPPPMESKEEL